MSVSQQDYTRVVLDSFLTPHNQLSHILFIPPLLKLFSGTLFSKDTTILQIFPIFNPFTGNHLLVLLWKRIQDIYLSCSMFRFHLGYDLLLLCDSCLRYILLLYDLLNLWYLQHLMTNYNLLCLVQ